MHVTAITGTLRQALEAAALTLNRRSTLPVLGAVLLTAEDATLRVRSTDLEVYLDQPVGARITTPGALAIPLKPLLDFVKTQPKDELITITALANKALIEGMYGTIDIDSYDAEEFPVGAYADTTPAFSTRILETDLLTALKATAFIGEAADGDARPILASTLVELNRGNALFVSCDNYRMALSGVTTSGSSDTEPRSVVLGARGTRVLTKLLDPKSLQLVTLEVIAAAYTRWTLDNGTILIARTIDGHYPNFRQVIPTGRDVAATFDTKLMAEATKTAGMIAKLDLTPDAVTLRSKIDGNDRSVRVQAQYDGPDQYVSLNPRYLQDLVKAPSKRVQMLIDGPLSPVLFKSPDVDSWSYVLMPVRTVN